MTDTLIIGYDSTDPANIPPNAALVWGYDDGIYQWTAADWARFPNAIKKTIAVRAGDDGDVLDIEEWDASPDQAPEWTSRQWGRGADPWNYMNASTWPDVLANFAASVVPSPKWWVAAYDGSETIPPGASARQYEDHANLYDITVAYASAFGITPTPLIIGDTVSIAQPRTIEAPQGPIDIVVQVGQPGVGVPSPDYARVYGKVHKHTDPWGVNTNVILGTAVAGSTPISTVINGQYLCLIENADDWHVWVLATSDGVVWGQQAMQ